MINKALPLGLALAAGFGVMGFFSDAVAQESFPTFQCDLPMRRRVSALTPMRR